MGQVLELARGAQFLRGEQGEEAGRDQEITTPEPARVRQQAKQPFEAVPNVSGLEIERGSDADHGDTGE